jgi:hypothetical protein
MCIVLCIIYQLSLSWILLRFVKKSDGLGIGQSLRRDRLQLRASLKEQIKTVVPNDCPCKVLKIDCRCRNTHLHRVEAGRTPNQPALIFFPSFASIFNELISTSFKVRPYLEISTPNTQYILELACTYIDSPGTAVFATYSSGIHARPAIGTKAMGKIHSSEIVLL